MAYSNGILFSHQGNLPNLPVPNLEETLDKYLKSIRPFTSDTEYEQSNKFVHDFKSGMGPVLQQRLLKRAEEMAKEDKSWLIDWWTEQVYLRYREPTVVNVNYFFAFQDDRFRVNPVDRAASIILNALEFKDLILFGDLDPDSNKKGSLCSEQYKFLFNATRIPGIPCDLTFLADPRKNTHFAVLRKGQFYIIESMAENVRISTSALKLQLEFIYENASFVNDQIGILTTLDRDTWAIARDHLIKISPKNKANLDLIESSSFLVCLDDTKPITKDEHSFECWAGNANNRFYDKSMQFIIFDNGKAGFNGEHSNMEATITHRCCDWILDNVSRNQRNGEFDVEEFEINQDLLPLKLEFELNEKIREHIKIAEEKYKELIGLHDLQVVTFEGYGKNLVKKFNLSPDAYAQMAIQLACYKLYGEPKATYETAGTRKFKRGRTEAGRSVSVESNTWVKAMMDPYTSISEKSKLGKLAINTQSSYMSHACEGKGIDRHLMGLKMLLEKDEDIPEIYKDAAFNKSSHWIFSTSQVTSEFYDGYGWGEGNLRYDLVYPDGFGVAYMIKNNSFQFNLVSRKLRNDHLMTFLLEALHEMRSVFENGISPMKSKL